MAKRYEIRTESYVHIGEKLVNTDDLTDEQRRHLATWLKTTYLNTLFLGRAEFYPVNERETVQAEGLG